MSAPGLTSRHLLAGTAASALILAIDPTALAAPMQDADAPAPDTEWRSYAADKANTRYSPLDQINAENFNDLEIAWSVKIPIITPSLIMTFVFSLIATLQVFAEPMTLRPLSNTISFTWTPLMKVYRDAFVRNDIYSAAATSVIIAVATFVISFGFLKLVGRRAFSQEG